MTNTSFESSTSEANAFENISGPATMFYKFGVPSMTIAVVLGVAVLIHSTPGKIGSTSPAAWNAMIAVQSLAVIVVTALSGPLKKVGLSENSLAISNFFNRHEVPLTSLQEVREISYAHYGSNRPVVLRFDPPTPFGATISFVPAGKPVFASLLSRRPSPIVQRLQDIAANNRRNSSPLAT